MKYKRILPHVFFILLVAIFVFIQFPPANNQPFSTKEVAKVSRVIDGDTIEVNLNNKKETIRLIGIDAPETVDPRKIVQCFGMQASDKTKEILTGKTIIVESDPTQGDRDKYRRLLRYVFLKDGTNFNKFMLAQGYAHEYTYQNNPYRYVEEFKKAEKKASGENLGLWNEDICKIP